MQTVGFLIACALILVGNLLHVIGVVLASPGKLVASLGVVLVSAAGRVLARTHRGKPWVLFARRRLKDGRIVARTWGRFR